MPRLEKPLDRGGEEDRAGQVPAPVVGGQLRAVEQRGGDRGNHGDPGRARLQPRQRAHQLGGQRLDLGAMEGVVHRQRSGPDSAAAPLLEKGLDVGCVAADHDGVGRVMRGHDDPVTPFEVRGRGLRCQPGQGHPAPSGQPLEQPSASGQDVHGLVRRDRSRHARRRDLAHAVPHDGRRPDAPCPPHRRQRHLEREDHRLRHHRLAQSAHVLLGGELGEDRATCPAPEQFVPPFHLFSEDGRSLEQPAAHAHPLRALPRVDEGHAVVVGAGAPAAERERVGPAGGIVVQRGGQLVFGAAGYGEAVVEVGPAERRRVTQVGKPDRLAAPRVEFRPVGERHGR